MPYAIKRVLTEFWDLAKKSRLGDVDGKEAKKRPNKVEQLLYISQDPCSTI